MRLPLIAVLVIATLLTGGTAESWAQSRIVGLSVERFSEGEGSFVTLGFRRTDLARSGSGVDVAVGLVPQGAREGASSDTLLTPNVLQGPPTPAAMFAITELDPHQLTRYLAAYRDQMGATWDTRYGVASALGMLNKAVARVDEDAARYYGAMAGRLWTRAPSRTAASIS
jgi:hypothetical protein